MPIRSDADIARSQDLFKKGHKDLKKAGRPVSTHFAQPFLGQELKEIGFSDTIKCETSFLYMSL